ncbi:TetR/AcrR family transcriptional regulator [uncultured Clostridium sp.]|uniref:TetR/AcrR family transcriptional regulator n=1 Tax=uncultured Clostridium sp. TaxID=59620 RepID=UPI002625ADEA|nr:TetR/AcrR family transcriptional regulator [uncultured Clostridium sp.]
MDNNTELQRRNILRQNNEESNAITRECIESALIQLMKTKSFQEISITDIAKRAGVSRNAYYRNYSSKEDILSGYLQNILSQMASALCKYSPLTETKECWIALLESLEPFYVQFKLLLDVGYGDHIRSEFFKRISLDLTPDTQQYYSNCYLTGALCNVIFEWIRNDMNLPLNEIAEIGCNLMINGIKVMSEYCSNE